MLTHKIRYLNSPSACGHSPFVASKWESCNTNRSFVKKLLVCSLRSSSTSRPKEWRSFKIAPEFFWADTPACPYIRETPITTNPESFLKLSGFVVTKFYDSKSCGFQLHEALLTLKSVCAPCHRNNAQQLCHFAVWTDGDRRDCNNRQLAWNHRLQHL